MKKLLCLILALACLPLPVLAETISPGDEIYIYNSAVIYDSYDRYSRQPLAVVPGGSIAIYLAAIDWGTFIVYDNYAGYIDEGNFRKAYSWESFRMPGSAQKPSSPSSGSGYTSYVPEFPYTAYYCSAIDRLATRSGPATKYTWTDFFPKDLSYRVFYQTKGSGVMWGYYEFTYQNAKYRLYSGMKRIDSDVYVPTDNEDYVYARITKSHTPHYGPGYDYAKAAYSIPSGTTVKAFYQQYGWLMYETTASDGSLQRAWAPAGYWE